MHRFLRRAIKNEITELPFDSPPTRNIGSFVMAWFSTLEQVK
jgi:hypothetical protein